MNQAINHKRESPQASTRARVKEAPHQRRLHRPRVNITPAERAGRIIIGVGAAVAGVVLLTTAASAVAVILEMLLILAGLDLVITGALGFCPLYHRLGHVPKSLRRPT